MGRLRLRFVLPALVFLLLAGAFWYVLGQMESGRYDGRVVPSAMLNKPMPAFRLEPPDGRFEGLADTDIRGRVAIVNVFASWCAPCLIEHPILVELSRDKRILVVGLNYKNDPKQAVAWLEEHGNPYARIGADRQGKAAIEWGVYGVPETFIVDANGIIRYRQAGPLTPQLVREEVKPILETLLKGRAQ
jgi:cytochrome c biogenesis protein CcmG/thiol:disulfide interchange protein DsbE